MKTSPNPSPAVRQLRQLIGRSQTQFAAMLGVSKDTIISVENGRNRLSRKLAARIYIATGALLRDDNPRRVDCPGKTYYRESFEAWRKDFYPSDEKAAKFHFRQISPWVELIFLAAAKSGVGGNRDRLPAVCVSLIEWLDQTRKDFKLDREIDALLVQYPGRLPGGGFVVQHFRGNRPLWSKLSAAIVSRGREQVREALDEIDNVVRESERLGKPIDDRALASILEALLRSMQKEPAE